MLQVLPYQCNMNFTYRWIEEEPIGCFPSLVKILMAQLKLADELYLSAMVRSDDSTSMTIYASSYSILEEGFVPLIYRNDENIYPEETKLLITNMQEVFVQEQLDLQPTHIIFMNLLKG